MLKTASEGKLDKKKKKKSTEKEQNREILLGPENRTFFRVEVKGI